ncbi:biotin--[acetyl-CoA-carboxylase] ligase [Halomonas denitrificans]|nr:biotin--[acetyl-CoA-carboxylase] ligase [Halomonas denitrificans]
MTDTALDLLERLGDADWHAGPSLSAALGVSRTAVWKQVEALREAGLPIESDTQRGYRLGRRIERLDARTIRSQLDSSIDSAVDSAIDIRVLGRCDSTNAELAGEGFAHRRAVLAEWQQAGRGRRGRTWTAPPGTSIALSFGYRFDVGLPRLGALSLVAGVAAARALAGLGAEGIGLKWPNDLVADGRKLGGLLVELHGVVDGPCDVVVGIGVNVWMPPVAARTIDQPWIDLCAIGPGPDRRNRIASALIESLDAACARLQAEGFGAMESEWSELDVLRGRAVRVERGDGTSIDGIVDGISERGGLWVRAGNDAQRLEFSAGEVSLRGRE